MYIYTYTGFGKSWFTVVNMGNTEFILVLLFISCCIIFHVNNCKPTFAPLCVRSMWRKVQPFLV